MQPFVRSARVTDKQPEGSDTSRGCPYREGHDPARRHHDRAGRPLPRGHLGTASHRVPDLGHDVPRHPRRERDDAAAPVGRLPVRGRAGGPVRVGDPPGRPPGRPTDADPVAVGADRRRTLARRRQRRRRLGRADRALGDRGAHHRARAAVDGAVRPHHRPAAARRANGGRPRPRIRRHGAARRSGSRRRELRPPRRDVRGRRVDRVGDGLAVTRGTRRSPSGRSSATGCSSSSAGRCSCSSAR